MNLTRAEAAALSRRQEQPVKAEGELLAVWVGGVLRNPLNGLKHWRAEKRYRREWKERTAMALFENEYRGAGVVGLNIGTALMVMEFQANTSAKRVHFIASTWNEMDDDGLMASLKPVRDGLVECGVISGDAPSDGHEFIYTQKIDRTHRGVEIRVTARRPGGE